MYSGIVPFFVDGGPQRILNVNLTVGSASGSAGLTASPNPLTFNVAFGSGFTSQNVNIFNSGVPVTLTSVSATTTTGQNWLQPSVSGAVGVVTVNITPSILATGSYSGTVFVQTTAGSMSFPVTLNVGTGGTGFGLAANPNPLTFNVASGSGISSQNANITFNGAAVGVTGVTSTTNTGQAWLQASLSGIFGAVLVSVNPSFLFSGSDSGTVFVSTAQGQVNFTVTLTVGSGGGTTFGLIANPNPVTLNVPFGASATSQNIAVTLNGSPITITSSSASTANGQAWLQSFVSGNTGFVTASVNPQILNSGFYTGSIFISTTAGTLTVPVNLTVGGGTNSAGLVVTPNPVNFNIALVGSGTAPQTATVTFNGVAAQITGVSSTTAGQVWLISDTSATPGVISLRINGANLTAGTYTATVVINTTSGTINLPVNLTVGGASTSGLAATPNPVFLNAPVGGSSSSQNVSITFNGAPATVTAVSASTTTGQNWLQAFTGGLSGAVTVTVSPTLLAAGTYTGTVSVTTTVGQVNFQVNLTVGVGGGTAGLAATPNPVSLTATVGGSVASQTVSVTANGAPATITGISSSTNSSVNWLQPFTSGTQGGVTVNANTSGLQAGSYSGTVTVTTTVGTTTFQVNLTVGGAGGTSGLVASPNPVSFTQSVAGQAGSQTISVTLNGTPQAINATTFAPLQIGLTFVNTAVNADGTVTLTVNNTVTTPGTYQGNLTLFTASGNVIVPVTLQFGTGGGSTSGLAANPSAATFNVQTGGSVPAQTVFITFNGFSTQVNSVTANTSTGQTWLLPSLAGSAGGVTISVNALGLLPGTYSGTVTANTQSGTLNLPVTLVVGGGGASGPTVIVNPVTLSPVNFQVGGATPAPQTLNISMSGGGALGFTASGSAITGGSWLSVSQTGSTTPGSATVSINTAGLTTPGTYQGSVTITVSGATNSPVTLPITLTVTAPVVTSPVVVAVQNAASGLATPLSPGLNIVIFGSNMGPATQAPLVVGSNGALATTVAGTTVTFDGVPGAIIYTSSNEVSVMVPYAVANRATTSLVVTYNGVSSAPNSYRVADAAPGIFTINRSGSGQGAILNQDSSINSAGNPESVGRFIQIFATGEGQTTPGGSDGAITPNRLPTPTPNLPVTVTIGGVPVPASDISFAGEAPSIVSGVIQINAKIPPGVGTGPVSIVIRVGGIPSQANVTVSVR